jgi:phosphatidylinositol dimannoside acyltransferase
VLYRVYRFCEWLASWLPPRGAYAIARVAGIGIFLFAGNTRRSLIANQLRLRPTATRREIARNARLASIAVAKNYYDLFRLPSMSKERILAYFDGQGLDNLEQLYARGKGVIVVAPHMGSYSLVPAFASCLGYPSVAVVERIRDERLHNYFLRLRTNHDLQVLTTGPEDVRNIIRAIRNGRVVMMLADRNVGTSSDDVMFFGERTLLPAGPALLARRTGAALLPAYSYRVGNTRSVAVGLPEMHLPDVSGTPEERRHADTQAVARKMEEIIRQAPDQWAVLQPVWPPQRPEAPALLSEAAG